MDSYVKDWLNIIENMRNDNTYKLAFGRGILEAIKNINMNNITEDTFNIDLSEIGENMLKYYWNQTYFFNLKQGPHSSKSPKIYQITEKTIDYYREKTGNVFPIWYDKAYLVLKENSYLEAVKKTIVTVMKQNVAWRFKSIDGIDLEIYTLDKKENVIIIKTKNLKSLKDYSDILIQLLNYKWAILLEKFNTSPKIANKVKGSYDRGIKRNNLSKYKTILLKQYKDRPIIDFYTGDVLTENEISIDHVIPWSFMFSDDIWNLVITSKSENSKKSNSIPSIDIIDKLKNRNQMLLSIEKDLPDAYLEDLKVSVDNNFVDKFYLNCKG